MLKFYNNRLMSKIIILHFRFSLHGELPALHLYRQTQYLSAKKKIVDCRYLSIARVLDETSSSSFLRTKYCIKNYHSTFSVCTKIIYAPCIFSFRFYIKRWFRGLQKVETVRNLCNVIQNAVETRFCKNLIEHSILTFDSIESLFSTNFSCSKTFRILKI